MFDLYDLVVPEMCRLLGQINTYLDKATQHAEAKKYDVNNLLGARLAVDQYPFVKQVQVTCDNAKGLMARLAGKQPPVHEDTEKTVGDLRARIDKTIAYVKSLQKSDFKGWEERPIDIFYLPGKYLLGYEYLTQFGIPNFHFHLVHCYAILRHYGVELGKAEYLGPISFREKK